MLPPRSRPRVSELTAAELRRRACEYRAMVAGASTAQIRDALKRLADRFEELAVRKARDEADAGQK